MGALDLARWQFGITTVYHFLFVPLTIGTSMLVAIMQTMWFRTNDEKWLKATKFFGKLFLINFAMGVVTGIVQEFQFGMAWSDYSRFVGDIFGAPLAVEALASFFLESTFLGLWIFGWDRLPRGLHLATIWAAALGTMLSAYFILAANSFMQHPVGYVINPETGRAELTNFGEVLFQNTTVATFAHVITSAFLVSGVGIVAVSLWLIMKDKSAPAMRSTLKLGAWTAIIMGFLVMYTGDVQAKIMVQQQPMKMAAAEALYETQENAPFSLVTVGNLDGSEAYWALDIPGLLSFMATGNWTGPESEVEGINNLQTQYEEKFGPGEYAPYVPLIYWAFRAMIGLGMLGVALRGLRPLGDPEGSSAVQEDRRAHLDGRRAGPAHRHLGRLDLHRDGPSALDRLRAHEDRGRCLADADHIPGRHVADRVHAALRRARGHRGRPAHPRREDRPAGDRRTDGRRRRQLRQAPDLLVLRRGAST